MSAPEFAGHVCPHCMSGSFRHLDWVDVPEIGSVHRVMCDGCETVYLDYTEEQKALQDRLEEESLDGRDAASEEAHRRILAEEHPEILLPFAARKGGIRIGMYATPEEAEAALREWCLPGAEPGVPLEVWHEPFGGKPTLVGVVE